jgi:hypothetical protein
VNRIPLQEEDGPGEITLGNKKFKILKGLDDLPEELRDKIHTPTPEDAKGYGLAVYKTHMLARDWIELNLGKEPKVQFNFPSKVFFSAVMTDALEMGAVTCNDDGREMLKAMGALSEDRNAPSVMMCRMAIEMLAEEKMPDWLRVQPVEVEPRICTHCGVELRAISHVCGIKYEPKPKDFTVCTDCGELSQFGPDMKLIKPDPQDVENVKEFQPQMWDKLSQVQEQIKKQRQEGGGEN